MNPEHHLVVKFLRYWNFNDAANLFVESISDTDIKISFHKTVENAIAELSDLNNELSLNSTSTSGLNAFFKNQQDLFEKVGKKYQLSQLSPALVINDELQSSLKSNVSNLLG